MRRRLVVIVAVLAALIGEWIGHSLSYLRVAGLGGLQASLGSGIHEYMAPLGLLLLAVAAAGATTWLRAWVALGRRLDDSAAALRQLRRRGPNATAAPGPSARSPALGPCRTHCAPPGPAPSGAPSAAARLIALAVPMATLQSALYLVQENLERAVHGLPAGGLAPLVDGGGAAALIQAGVALLLATAILAGTRLLRRRAAVTKLYERIVRSLWERALRGAAVARPAHVDVRPARLILRSAIWCRPPPVPASA